MVLFFKTIRTFRLLLRDTAIVAIVLLISMLFIESIVRKFIGFSIFTVNEYGGMGMYLFVVLSVSYLYEIEAHLNSDFIINILSSHTKKRIKLFTDFLTFCFACFCFYIWYKYLFSSAFKTGKSYRMTGIIEWPFHLLALVSWAILGITALEKLTNGVFQKSRNNSK